MDIKKHKIIETCRTFKNLKQVENSVIKSFLKINLINIIY